LGTYRAFVELRGPRRTAAGVWLVALAVAMIPLIPTPIDADQRSATPEFITSGSWENYVSDGTLVTALVAAIAVLAVLLLVGAVVAVVRLRAQRRRALGGTDVA
ncbi:hypothetical protein, partial [Aeromicrobium sp. REDSEA-S32_B7]|uniref:hypothetical protein n=1 Tax=Aeromicrobium sp. REDSEA-S32_B7 TaxID=1811526 RepID=UPI000A720873